MSVGESYYRFETADGCLIVTLLPELNDKQWADIEKVGTEIVDRLSTVQSPRLIVDLTLLSYMGSAMVALIVRLYKAVNGRSGQMVVVNQHELVFEVLKLAGLTKLWTIVDIATRPLPLSASSGGRSRPTGGPPPRGERAAIAGCRHHRGRGVLIGLALQFSPHPPRPRARWPCSSRSAFAALGMVVGTMMLVNQTGARRNVGIVFLAICLLVVLGGIVVGPRAIGRPNAGSATSATAPAPVTTDGLRRHHKPASTTVPTTAPPTKADPSRGRQQTRRPAQSARKSKDK